MKAGFTSEFPRGLVGLGLRQPHLAEVLLAKPQVGWMEVHSENYFGDHSLVPGLLQVRRDYPVALHGVAMGLLSPDAPCERHLAELEALVAQVQPVLVSEHLCWNRLDGVHHYDLLPVPAMEETVALAVERSDFLQTRLKRRIAVENLTSYVRFAASTLSEGDYLAEICRRSGCGLLLDLENLHLNERNHGEAAAEVMAALSPDMVMEFHVAGHRQQAEQTQLDTHDAPVPEPVWALLQVAVRRFGPKPVLVERDANLPPLATLLYECARAARTVDV